jgi:hypothetical protein
MLPNAVKKGFFQEDEIFPQRLNFKANSIRNLSKIQISMEFPIDTRIYATISMKLGAYS